MTAAELADAVVLVLQQCDRETYDEHRDTLRAASHKLRAAERLAGAVEDLDRWWAAHVAPTPELTLLFTRVCAELSAFRGGEEG